MESRLTWGGNYSIELTRMREQDRHVEGDWRSFDEVVREMDSADKRDESIRARALRRIQ